MRLLREPLGLGLDSPSLSPIQIAFFRGLFGGLIMLALVRRSEIRFRPAMMAMVIAFSVMSVLYLSALGLGAAANAIFLQNTAPVWVYLLAVLFLGERADWHGIQIVALATLGAVVIVVGGWPRRLPPEDEHRAGYVLLMGLGSGFVYAVVVLFLRVLREQGAAWLVALNLLGTAATLGLYVAVHDGPSAFASWASQPSARQFALLAVFGDTSDGSAILALHARLALGLAPRSGDHYLDRTAPQPHLGLPDHPRKRYSHHAHASWRRPHFAGTRLAVHTDFDSQEN